MFFHSPFLFFRCSSCTGLRCRHLGLLYPPMLPHFGPVLRPPRPLLSIPLTKLLWWPWHPCPFPQRKQLSTTSPRYPGPLSGACLCNPDRTVFSSLCPCLLIYLLACLFTFTCFWQTFVQFIWIPDLNGILSSLPTFHTIISTVVGSHLHQRIWLWEYEYEHDSVIIAFTRIKWVWEILSHYYITGALV